MLAPEQDPAIALASLVRWLGGPERWPRMGYGSRRPGRIMRAVQVFRLLCDVFMLPFRGIAALVHGPDLPYLKGRFYLRQDRLAGTAIRELCRRGGALIVFPQLDVQAPVRNLRSELGLDPDDQLEGAITGNAVLVFFGSHCGRPVIVHKAIPGAGEPAIERHRAGLAAAWKSFRGCALTALLPELVNLPGSGDTVMQSLIPGRPAAELELTERDFELVLDKACDVQHRFFELGVVVDGGPEQSYLPETIAKLREHLPPAILHRVELAAALLDDWPERALLPAVPIHGDYWLGNVIVSDCREIIGIVDWEWHRTNGLPLLDALHLLVQAYSGRLKRPYAELLAQLLNAGKSDTPLRRRVDELLRRTGIRQRDQQRIALFLWLDLLRRGYIDTAPPDSEWIDRMTLPIADKLAALFAEGGQSVVEART